MPPFVTFEGGEGAGKSTQIARLHEALSAQGIPVTATHEPGGTEGAQAIRQLLVNGPEERWLPASEILLFYAARLDLVERVVRPALANGAWVLCDRFADSTLAYQGYAMGQGVEKIRQLHQLMLGDFAPDLTFIFDLDPVLGLQRAVARDGTKKRYEAMDIDFHQRLRAGFLDIAKHNPERCVVIDAAQDKDAVSKYINQTVIQRFGLNL